MKSVSGKELCKVVESYGWELKRTRGSHHIYSKEGGLSSSYGDKQDLLKGGKGERVRGKGVLMTRSIAV